MSYILSSKVLEGINVEKIFSEISDGYLQITPKVIKTNVVNLGMTKSELIEIANLRTNLKVFNKDFNEDKLSATEYDALILSDGNVDSNEITHIAAKIKNMIGNKAIIGMGLGKQVVDLALEELETDKDFIDYCGVMKHKKYDIYYCDNEVGKLKEVLEKI